MIFVEQPTLTTDENGYNTVSSVFNISSGIKKQSLAIWYRTRHAVNPTADIFLIASLLPAMSLGEDLMIGGFVSLRLRNSLDKIQDRFSSWFPELKRIKINAWAKTYFEKQEDKSTASFFTCGVDSFYTLLKHKNEIKKIVYVHGFDVWMHETKFRNMMSGHLHTVADAFGKELIEVETNLHEFSDNFVHWEKYHGAALGSVAALLSNNIDKIYIASSELHTSFREPQIPWGSHPETDPLWSTDMVEIIHDGDECNRAEKVSFISKNETCLSHLRVCLERESGKYNCCRCEKCIRTMVSLHIANSLHKCSTFENVNETELVNRITPMKIKNEIGYLFAVDNFRNAPEGELKNALGKMIDDYENNLKK